MPLKMIVPALFISVLLVGCNSEEIARLRTENEALKKELQNHQAFNTVIRHANEILDSIDISRKLLRSELKNGTSQTIEFSERLREIHQYVKLSEAKISNIEKELRSSRNEAFAYLMMVDALKGEVGIRDGEVQQLESTVATFQNENIDLRDSVKFQGTMVADMHTSIEQKQQHLSSLESKVHQLEKEFKLTEAEVYYARARLIEEAARRTKLAPQKKRQTYTEALELYRKAFSLGKEEARQHITELQQALSIQLSALTENSPVINK